MRSHGWAGNTPASDEEAIERILDAADKIIGERGSAMRIADVARTLGVTRQTVYRYFPGTEALRVATAMRSADGFLDQLTTHVKGMTDPVIAITEGVAFAIEQLRGRQPSRTRTQSTRPRRPGLHHVGHRGNVRALDAASLRRGLGAVRFRRGGAGRTGGVLSPGCAFLPCRRGSTAPQRRRSAALSDPMDRARDRLSPAGPGDGCAAQPRAASPAQLISRVLIPVKRLRIRRIVPSPPGEDAGRRVQSATMIHHKGRTTIALCGAAATLAFAVGYGPGEDPASTSSASSSSVTVTRAPPPAPGTLGDAFPAVPAGGGGCYIGLNCGCIPRITCPTPHRRPPAVAPGHDAAGGPNP